MQQYGSPPTMPEAGPPTRPHKAKRFEYRVIERSVYVADLEPTMNKLGAEGFELVNADAHTYVFMRAK